MLYNKHQNNIVKQIYPNKNAFKKGKVTTNTTETQRIIRDYHKQLCASKMDKLKETDKFLGKYNLPRLSQEEIENTNRPII